MMASQDETRQCMVVGCRRPGTWTELEYASDGVSETERVRLCGEHAVGLSG